MEAIASVAASRKAPRNVVILAGGTAMLVLTRRIGEQIVIDSVISVTVLTIEGGQTRLGISAPPSVRVDRSEVHERRLASHPAVPRPSVSSNVKE